MTVGEAFQTFKELHPEKKIGKSKFSELRPQHVLLASNMPHNVCGCKYHANIILLLEALHRACPAIPLYAKEVFIKLCVCNPENEDCMSNNCFICMDNKAFDTNLIPLIENLDAPLSWSSQGEDQSGYLAKLQKNGSVQDAINELKSQLPKFLWHVFLKQKQADAYESDKAKAREEGSEECVLQMDFAENFTASFQDEIQSAHWNQRQKLSNLY